MKSLHSADMATLISLNTSAAQPSPACSGVAHRSVVELESNHDEPAQMEIKQVIGDGQGLEFGIASAQPTSRPDSRAEPSAAGMSLVL